MSIKWDIRLQRVKVVLPNGKRLFKIDSLHIEDGEHLLVRGPSGSGKTTLLHLIAGLFSPREGYVHVGPYEVTRMTDDHLCDLRRSSIGVIFQKLNLVDHMTVLENITLGQAESARLEVGHAKKILEHLNLKGRENDRCSYLSLGEQQRVAVARVLEKEPSVILADEPTSSLDQANSDFVISELIKASKKRTLVVVSHDHRIEDRFDRVIDFSEFTS